MADPILAPGWSDYIQGQIGAQPGAQPTSSQGSTGVDWAAVQSMVNAGYIANPDGTITRPDGTKFTPPATANPATTTGAPDTSASTAASVDNLLHQYGLEELVPQIDGWVRQGLTWPEIEAMLRDPSTPAGQVFDRAYPEIRMRTEKHLAPMSVEQIQSYRTQAKQALRGAGLPEGFYDDNSDFTAFITGDVSVNELQARIQEGYLAASQAPAEVKAELKDYYGVDEGGIAAYFLDPTRALPVIQRQIAAAKIGGAAARVGISNGLVSSERLASLGVDENQASQIFGQVAKELPTLQDLQKRFNDPGDPLTADKYAEALVINDPKQLLTAARLVAQEHSLFSSTGLFAQNQGGGLTGLGAR
jgi:hypothetical protein